MNAGGGGAERARSRVAVAILALLLALFFLPALRPDAQFLGRDTGRIHHPVRRWIAERLGRGEIPEWNPYAGLGAPVVGGAMDAPFHPFNAWLVALPYEAGFKAWVLSCYLAAALGGYALARALGCRWHSAVVAGAAFALSGHVVSSSDNLTFLATQAALPWVLASGQRFFERGGPGALAGVGVASLVCAAGGDPQGWAVAMALLFAQGLLLGPEGSPRRERLVRSSLAAGMGVLAAAPVLLPVVAWLPSSSRAAGLRHGPDLDWDLRPLRLVELLVPGLLREEPGVMTSAVFDAFGGARRAQPWVASIHFGVPALLLAVFAAARERRARVLVAGAALLGWAALGHHAGFGQLARHVPVLNAFRYWEKLFVFPTLLACVAAALGLDALSRATGAERRRLAWIAAGSALALAVASAGAAFLAPGLAARAGAPALWRNFSEGALTSALACAALAAACAAPVLRPALSRLTPALAAAAVVLAPFAGNAHAYVLGRAPSAGTAPLAGALAAVPLRRLFTPFSFPAQRGEGLTELDTGMIWGRRTLEACWNVPEHVGNLSQYGALPPARLETLRSDTPAARFASAAGAWSVEAVVVPADPDLAVRAGVLPPPLRILAADPALPAFLVAVPHRPRARLAGEIVQVEERAALERARAGAPPFEGTTLEAAVPPGYRPPRGRVWFVRDDPERIELGAESDGPALLVLEDQHAPGWTARVDGAPVPILRADYLGRAVWIPAGRHEVAFSYRTPGLRAGAALAAAAFALTACWWVARRRRGAMAAR